MVLCVCVQLSVEAVKRVNDARTLMRELLEQNKGETTNQTWPIKMKIIINELSYLAPNWIYDVMAEKKCVY